MKKWQRQQTCVCCYLAFWPMCCTFWIKLPIYCCFKTFYLSIVLFATLDTARIFYFILICVWHSINWHLLQRLQPLTSTAYLSPSQMFPSSEFQVEREREFTSSLSPSFRVLSSMYYLTWEFTYSTESLPSSEFNSLLPYPQVFEFRVQQRRVWGIDS